MGRVRSDPPDLLGGADLSCILAFWRGNEEVKPPWLAVAG